MSTIIYINISMPFKVILIIPQAGGLFSRSNLLMSAPQLKREPTGSAKLIFRGVFYGTVSVLPKHQTNDSNVKKTFPFLGKGEPLMQPPKKTEMDVYLQQR